jgi:Zn-dependent M28 family amino/carboxypeptidase
VALSLRPLVPVLAALALGACLGAAEQARPSFDGARAFRDLEQLVAIGPRPAGSPGIARARAHITQQLAAIGVEVREQPFDARTPLGTVRMVNLRATLRADPSKPRLIVAGHYDTKLFQHAAFVGANDGASSAAFLIEFARAMRDRPGSLPIEIVFFDGEEAVVQWQGTDRVYGSRHYVEAARQDGTLQQIGALVLVDMIGERNPRFRRDTNSTAWLTELIWARARALGRREFVDETTAIEDDHLPFLDAGVPAVDIIDLDYPAWHTPDDTIDKVSAASLQAVGDVLVAALPDVEARLLAAPAR